MLEVVLNLAWILTEPIPSLPTFSSLPLVLFRKAQVETPPGSLIFPTHPERTVYLTVQQGGEWEWTLSAGSWKAIQTECV